MTSGIVSKRVDRLQALSRSFYLIASFKLTHWLRRPLAILGYKVAHVFVLLNDAADDLFVLKVVLVALMRVEFFFHKPIHAAWLRMH